MAQPLKGVRILELASHVFVPIAGGILTEWGAEVIKVEHPVTGDPYRGLVSQGLHQLVDGIDPSFQSTNRGKQSVAIDLKREEGRDLVCRLAKECDVFLTNFRQDARRKLRIDPEDIRAHNPNIIYVRGTGYGARGPEVQRGGYDAAAYWMRSGHGFVFTKPDAELATMQRPAYGDVMGGLNIAGAISAALYRRATTGEPSIVDVSLLGTGMWQLGPDIMNAGVHPESVGAQHDRKATWNPIVGTYKTRDGRFLHLNMMEGDRYWADTCTLLGRPDLIDDPRFIDMPTRKQNARECVTILDEIFAASATMPSGSRCWPRPRASGRRCRPRSKCTGRPGRGQRLSRRGRDDQRIEADPGHQPRAVRRGAQPAHAARPSTASIPRRCCSPWG